LPYLGPGSQLTKSLEDLGGGGIYANEDPTLHQSYRLRWLRPSVSKRGTLPLRSATAANVSPKLETAQREAKKPGSISNTSFRRKGSIMWFMLLAIPDHAKQCRWRPSIHRLRHDSRSERPDRRPSRMNRMPHLAAFAFRKSPPCVTIPPHTPSPEVRGAPVGSVCRTRRSSCVPLRGCGKNSRRASKAWIGRSTNVGKGSPVGQRK